MKTPIKEDIPYKFWKKYEKADQLEREKLLKPIIKNFMPLFNIKDEEMREHILKTQLISYFGDLIDYFYMKK